MEVNKRSVRAEYRYHHISNHNTANENPRIDNRVFQLTYAFGRGSGTGRWPAPSRDEETEVLA